MWSRTGFSAIGAGIGALIGSVAVDLVAHEYGWAGAGLGGLIGVYVGYWIFDQRTSPDHCRTIWPALLRVVCTAVLRDS